MAHRLVFLFGVPIHLTCKLLCDAGALLRIEHVYSCSNLGMLASLKQVVHSLHAQYQSLE